MNIKEAFKTKAEIELKAVKTTALSNLIAENTSTLRKELFAEVELVAKYHRTIYRRYGEFVYLIRGLGNDVVYVQESKTETVISAYYVDTKSGKMINVLKLNPNAFVSLGEFWSKNRFDGLVSFMRTIENKPTNLRIEDLEIPDDVRESYNTIIAPAHELMHDLHINKSISIIYSDMKDIFTKHHGRGPSKERVAVDMTFAFIRRARGLGIDILRDINKKQLIVFVNRLLTFYE